MKRLKFTLRALAELDAILADLAVASPTGARNVSARLRSKLDLLCLFPEQGVRTEDDAIRRVSVTPYPYLIFYAIEKDAVLVHSISHAARDPASRPDNS